MIANTDVKDITVLKLDKIPYIISMYVCIWACICIHVFLHGCVKHITQRKDKQDNKRFLLLSLHLTRFYTGVNLKSYNLFLTIGFAI